ncbi:Gfo/Idh/MocA family protein [Aestuariibius sp. 2305UL40-4]|uniref:Gfo/Idh/MocA family protein n=1 Tax=Aestuariibius violaceus TaxID=3234132 RepID=UPI00345E0D8D
MRPLRLGMVGGGQGAFIGAVHRIAARLDGHWQLVAGAFSSDAARAHASAAELNVAPDRSYADFAEMARAEAARDDGIEAVSIVTPNHMHAPVATAFLEAGIPVICDKPLTATLPEAEALAETVARTGTPFFLTHNYTGYPLIREAREIVARGDLGRLRVVQAEYAQDWLAEKLEETGQKQAAWRTDPAKSGAGGAIGDIGTHAFNLLEFVTGTQATHLAADLTSFVDGRRLDDNAHILLRLQDGAKGMLWASQIAPGHENGLRLRIYGDKAGLEWSQEDPNRLRFTRLGAPAQWLTRAGAGTGSLTTRIPPGHPEGYLEAFATLYTEAASDLRQPGAAPLLPGIEDGLRGMRFVTSCVTSARNDCAWTAL